MADMFDSASYMPQPPTPAAPFGAPIEIGGETPLPQTLLPQASVPVEYTEPVDPRESANQAAMHRDLQRAEQLTQSRADLARQQAGEMRPLREAQLRSISQPRPQPPQLRQPPKAPTAKDAEMTDDRQNWFNAAMFLGVLGGALTRQPITNALGVFAGLMEGRKEGEETNYRRMAADWDRSNKEALEANATAQTQYDRIIKADDLDVQQKEMALKIVASQQKDDQMAQSIESEGLLAAAQLRDQRDRYSHQLKGSSAALTQAYQDRQFQEFISSPGFETRAQDIAQGRVPIPSLNQRNPFVNRLNTALYDRAKQYNPALTANDFRVNQTNMLSGPRANAAAASTTARLEASIDPMTARRTEIAFAVGTQGNSVASLNRAIDHLSVLEKLTKALQNKEINIINKYKNYIQSELGSPAPTNFDAARQIIGQEIVKAVVTNGGGVQEREETKAYIDKARSEDQLFGLVHTYERLMAGQLHGLQQQYQGGGGRKDFEKTFLRPETRETLERIYSGDIPSNIPIEMVDHIQRLADKFQSFANEAVTGISREAAGVMPEPGFFRRVGEDYDKYRREAPVMFDVPSFIQRIQRMFPGATVEPLPGDMPVPTPPR